MPTKIPKVNKVILIIVLVMFFMNVAGGVAAPIFAVFVSEQILYGTVAIVGIGIAIYWMVKSILQLGVAWYIDRNHGEIDDFRFMLVGGFMYAIIVSFYFFATQIWHVYLLQLLIGVADALWVPPFYAIFTRHIDKGREGFEWSLYSSFSIGAGLAIGGALGGSLAVVFGLRSMFPLIGFLSLISVTALLFLKPYMRTAVPKKGMRIPLEEK